MLCPSGYCTPPQENNHSLNKNQPGLQLIGLEARARATTTKLPFVIHPSLSGAQRDGMDGMDGGWYLYSIKY